MDKIIFEKVGTRLKHARELRHITLEEAGKKVDVHKSTVLRWENGETEKIKLPVIEMLASFYNVNPVWLMGYDVPMEEKKFDNFSGVDKKTTNSATVFVYGKIPAGTPIELIEDILDTEEIDADMLRGGKQYFGLRVKGHSMEPEYLDGDTLILLKQDDCESGEDAIVMVNGDEGTFKRVIKDEEKKTIRLQPLNTQLDENGLPLYEPIIFTKDQIEKLPVKIIGVVEEIRRKKKRK